MNTPKFDYEKMSLEDIQSAIQQLNDLAQRKKKEREVMEKKLPPETRRKLLMGEVLQKLLDTGALPAQVYEQALDKQLKRITDRRLFDLETPTSQSSPEKEKNSPSKSEPSLPEAEIATQNSPNSEDSTPQEATGEQEQSVAENGDNASTGISSGKSVNDNKPLTVTAQKSPVKQPSSRKKSSSKQSALDKDFFG
jgi:hypothetical protein